MNNLDKEYGKILDDGFSITELYIYASIVEDGRCYGLSAKEIEDMVNQVQEIKCSTCLSLEEIINKVLDGDELMEDDEEWY